MSRPGRCPGRKRGKKPNDSNGPFLPGHPSLSVRVRLAPVGGTRAKNPVISAQIGARADPESGHCQIQPNQNKYRTDLSSTNRLSPQCKTHPMP
jgi:hypothetical protein